MNLRGFYSLILIIAFCFSLGAEEISDIKKLTPDFFKDNLKKSNLTEKKDSIEKFLHPVKTIEQNNFEQRKYDFYDSLILFKMADNNKSVMTKILKKWNSLNISSPSLNAVMVDSYEPNDTFSQATTIIIGDTMESLDIDPMGDVDFFKFDAVAGDTITIGIIASTEGSSLDSYIYLYGTDQSTLLVSNDDYYSYDSRILYYVISTTGTYYIKVRDYSNGGGADYWYSLFVIYDTPPITGTITGRVLDYNLNPVSNVDLDIFDVDNGDYIWPNGGTTDANGYYYFDDVPEGNYKIVTDDYSYGLLNEWYDNKASFDDADIVTVIGYDTTENIDFELSKGGVITGQIYSETDSQLISSDFLVIAFDTYGNPVREAWTNTSTYMIDGLPQGNIRICIEDYNSNYGSEWYKDKTDLESADNVAVSLNDTVRGIDFYLSTSGILKGRVVNEEGEACFAVVIAFDDFGEIVGDTLTNDSGYYQISGFFDETYKLFALPTDSNGWNLDTAYSYEWYNDCYFWDDATGIFVSAGDTVEDIDFVLNSIGVVDGYVMDESFSPVDSVEVLGVTDLSPVYNMIAFYGALSDSNGYYRMPASASYYKFVAFSNYYNEQWFYLENDYYDARELYLAPGAALRNVNFILVSNGVLADKKQFTGASQFNAIVSSSVISGDISVMVYSSLASTEGISVSLVDITGREVYSSKFSMNSNSKIITLPTKNSPSGVYFLRVSHNGKEFTSKVSILK